MQAGASVLYQKCTNAQEKNDLNMGIDPELKAFFVASTAVSREK